MRCSQSAPLRTNRRTRFQPGRPAARCRSGPSRRAARPSRRSVGRSRSCALSLGPQQQRGCRVRRPAACRGRWRRRAGRGRRGRCLHRVRRRAGGRGPTQARSPSRAACIAASSCQSPARAVVTPASDESDRGDHPADAKDTPAIAAPVSSTPWSRTGIDANSPTKRSAVPASARIRPMRAAGLPRRGRCA